jgi:hypothetical protein
MPFESTPPLSSACKDRQDARARQPARAGADLHGSLDEALEVVSVERVCACCEECAGAADRGSGVNPPVVHHPAAIDAESRPVVGVGAKEVDARGGDREQALPGRSEEVPGDVRDKGTEGVGAVGNGEVDGVHEGGSDERERGNVGHGAEAAEGAGVVDLHEEAAPALGDDA